MLQELRKLSQDFLKIKNSPYRRYFIQTDPFKHRLSLVLGQFAHSKPISDILKMPILFGL